MPGYAQQIIKAREFNREIAGWSLTLRRPTDQEAGALFRGDGVHPVDVAVDFVVDWHGVTEADLIVSGGSHEVAFDRSTWREVVVDHPELWEPISDAIAQAWTTYNATREERKKK